MDKRQIAEQALANHLLKRGLIESNNDLMVKRLNPTENFSVFIDKVKMGNVDYEPRLNRYINLVINQGYLRNISDDLDNLRKKDVYTIMDYLKYGKIRIKR